MLSLLFRWSDWSEVKISAPWLSCVLYVSDHTVTMVDFSARCYSASQAEAVLASHKTDDASLVTNADQLEPGAEDRTRSLEDLLSASENWRKQRSG